MDIPSTSKRVRKRVEDDKITPQNIGPLTYKLLERILRKLQLEQTSRESFPLVEPVARTAWYTGMNKLNVKKLLAFGDNQKFNNVEIDRQVIHRCLTNMYIFSKHIPTITELFLELGDKLPIYVNLDYFIKILIQMGYVFYKFPGRKALRVMEKKAVTFERYNYLKKVQQYRTKGISIIYVGFVSITSHTGIINLERTFQMDPKNITGHILFTATIDDIHNVEIIVPSTYEELQDHVKKWLLSIFTLHNLTPGAVCILEDSKIFRETLVDIPTWKSVKADMLEWLEEHNIPCHINMPKADLLYLIETFTDTHENTFVIDNFAKTHGYSILRLPQCINGLSIIPFVIRVLNNNFNVNLMIKEYGSVLQNMSRSHLRSFFKIVEDEEIHQMAEDNTVDDILDDLVKDIKKLDVEDNEDDHTLPTFSDLE